MKGKSRPTGWGRVIRLQRSDVESFIEQSRVQPGTLKHLYPDTDAGNGIV